MISIALNNFIKHQGYDRLVEVFEILNDGKEDPQERIGRLLHISNDQVPEYIGRWFNWSAGYRPEVADALKSLADLARFEREKKKK